MIVCGGLCALIAYILQHGGSSPILWFDKTYGYWLAVSSEKDGKEDWKDRICGTALFLEYISQLRSSVDRLPSGVAGAHSYTGL